MNTFARSICAVLIMFATQAGASEGSTERCEPVGDLNFVCGPQRPEDIVMVPGGHWLIASGMVPGAGLHLVDVHGRSWRHLRFAPDSVSAREYPDCSAPPAAERFIAHGLDLVPGRQGRARLYVTSHGEREAIEIFDLSLPKGQTPSLTWKGCLRAPDGIEFNSVAATRGKMVLATTLHLQGMNLADAFEGKSTGAVFAWKPGDRAFREVPGTRLRGNNGIAISADGKTAYVAASPARQVTAFRTGANWRKLWTVEVGNFLPDNLRWGSDGRLYTAGMTDDEPGCGGPVKVRNGTLDLVSCLRGFGVASISPNGRIVQNLYQREPSHDFAGVATAIPAGGSIWFSSFFTNRIAYHPWPISP